MLLESLVDELVFNKVSDKFVKAINRMTFLERSPV